MIATVTNYNANTRELITMTKMLLRMAAMADGDGDEFLTIMRR